MTMKKIRTVVAIVFAGIFCPSVFAQKPVVIGYVGGFRGLVDAKNIAAEKLTHINYAFVDIKNNRAWLHNEVTDSINFKNLNGLKQRNPALKILISIGGWAWSENFSDAVLSDTSRRAFAKSSVDIIAKYNLDGVDIDWEYPGMAGEEGNIYRPEDKQNYTLMFRDIRLSLDSLAKITGKKYLLTTAVGGSKSYVEHTEMNLAQTYLDYINLMTYDYGGGKLSAHHTNLYASNPADTAESSADRSVRLFLKAGVPKSKLVVGLAFYGKGSTVSGTMNRGFGQEKTGQFRSGGYSTLKDSLSHAPGFKRYWDSKAKAPYLFNANTKQFVTYDDERSVKQKCKYVRQNGLAGVMFWEYSSDPKGYLLDAAVRSLK